MHQAIPTDDQLILAVMNDDQNAFQSLHDRYYDMLFKIVVFRTGDPSLSQDVVQETFLKLWFKRRGLKPGRSLMAFMTKIARNLVQDHYKHLHVVQKYEPTLQEMMDRVPDNPDQQLQAKTLQDLIRKVVNEKLAPKCRNVFVLSRIEGMTNQQIADCLGVSKKTVENQLYHAMSVLKKVCKNYL